MSRKKTKKQKNKIEWLIIIIIIIVGGLLMNFFNYNKSKERIVGIGIEKIKEGLYSIKNLGDTEIKVEYHKFKNKTIGPLIGSIILDIHEEQIVPGKNDTLFIAIQNETEN